MDVTESLIGPINEAAPLPPETNEPTIIPPDTHSSSENGLGSLFHAWKKSIWLKILSVMVFVPMIIMIVFIALTTSHTSELTECNNHLSQEKTLNNDCSNQKSTLQREVDELQTNINTEKRTKEDLETKLNGLQTTNNELKKKSGEIEQEITKLTEQNQALTNNINKLQEDIRNVEADIQRIGQDIETTKAEITKKHAEIVQLQGYKIYYYIALGVSLSVDIYVIPDMISTISQLSEETSKTENFTKENEVLAKKILELEAQIKTANEDVIAINKVIEGLRKQHDVCQTELSHLLIKYETCNDLRNNLKQDLLIMPTLALEQAELVLLQRKAKQTVNVKEMYRATNDQFNREAFYSKMKDNPASIVIFNTTHGRVFGGSISMKWPTESRTYEDRGAFTFSVNHGKICAIKENYIQNAITVHNDYMMIFGTEEIKIQASGQKYINGTAQTTQIYNCEPNDYNFYEKGNHAMINEIIGYKVEIIA